MRKILTVLSLTLVIALSFALFAACNNEGDGNKDESQSASQNETLSASGSAPSSIDGSSGQSSSAHTEHDLVLKFDSEGHWQECSECGYKTEVTAHTLNTACDENHHWQECECGYESEKTAHAFVGGSCTVCGFEKLSLTLEFQGEEESKAGFAQGLFTLTKQSGFKQGDAYRLYWGDETGALDMLPVAEAVSGANATSLSFTIEENVAVPSGADRLTAYYINDDLKETSVATCMLPAEKKNSENIVRKFASVSDVHCNYVQGEKYWANALKEFAAAGVEFIINSGDIGESNSDYSKYVNAAKESDYCGLIFACIGNHDQTTEGRVNFYNYAIYDGAAKKFVALDKAAEYFASEYAGGMNVSVILPDGADGDTCYYAVTIDNDVLVFMDQELRSAGGTTEMDNFSVAQLDFVESILYKYSGEHETGGEFNYDKYNLFIVEHAPVEVLKVGDKYEPGYGGQIRLHSAFTNNLRFVSLLKEYSESIWISGHTHVQFDAGIIYLDKVYDNNGTLTDTPMAHSIHNSSVAQPRFYQGNKMIYFNDYTEGSQGYICYQYESVIVYEAHIFKYYTPGDYSGDDSLFVNDTDAAHCYAIPLGIKAHEAPAEPINYAFAANGVKRQGSLTFIDTDDGLKVTFNSTGDRFEIKLGDQQKAYELAHWLSFYIDTDLTKIQIGGCNSSGLRYNTFTLDLSASGDKYKVKDTDDGKKFVQIPISALYNSNNINELSIRFYDVAGTGELTFTLSDMYIGVYEDVFIRGDMLIAKTTFEKVFAEDNYTQVEFEYKILNGGTINLALLCPDWSKYYGYITFTTLGPQSNYAGVTYEKLNDDYIKVTIELEELTVIYKNVRPDTIDRFYINKNSTAEGYVDSVRFIKDESAVWHTDATKHWHVISGNIVGEEDHSFGDWISDELGHHKKCPVCGYETAHEAHSFGDGDTCTVCGGKKTVVRGDKFVAGNDLTKDVTPGAYTKVEFDYYVLNDGSFNICLLDDGWSNYFGYFEFDRNGSVGTFAGVTCEKLDDGYYHVTIIISEVNKIHNETPQKIYKLYVRGGWTTASGYIDNITCS